MALRARINKPSSWEDVVNVQYSDVRTIVNGAMSTEPAPQAGTRNDQYTYQGHTLTADTLTISTYEVLPSFIDEADRYQQTYINQMNFATRQGKIISERLETVVLAEHGNWTNFGVTDLANT